MVYYAPQFFLSRNILELKIIEKYFGCSQIWLFRFYNEKNIQQSFHYTFFYQVSYCRKQT